LIHTGGLEKGRQPNGTAAPPGINNGEIQEGLSENPQILLQQFNHQMSL
tara:strand:+ start:1460 stop:1606 length:147 start_codon:yes stop_codon:yes gene_type:complete